MTRKGYSPSYRRLLVTKGQLVDWYVTQRLSQTEIARRLGCSQPAVSLQLQKHGIQSRTLGEAQLARNERTPPARGASHPHFKTGKNRMGYAVTRILGRNIKVHRLVVEELIGRRLARSEAVHHSNGIKDDNRPENLWVFPTNVAHRAYHDHGVIHPDTIFLKDFT